MIVELIEYAYKDKIDMVIMEPHGNRGLNEILIGSNAQKMIRYSKVPVMVVKNDKISPSFKKVVYTSDFKEHDLNDSLSCVKSIVEYYKADLHLS